MWANRRAIIGTCLFGIFSLPALSQDVSGLSTLSVPPSPVVATESSSRSAEVSSWHSSQAKVTFENGQLSIFAENSTLQEVLEAVHQKTGTKVEAPYLDPARITVELGPGDPTEVLAKLLYGIHFNYIILGTTGEIRQPEKIIITPRTEMTVASNFPPPQRTVPQIATPEQTETVTADDAAKTEEDPGDLAKKDADADADPNADKDQNKDKDEVADKKDPGTGDDKAADDARTDDPAVAAAMDPPAIGEEPSAAERMANLPDGVNPAMAALYPSLFGNGSQSATGPSTGSTVNPGSLPFGSNPTQRGLPQAYSPVPIQLNSAGVPVLPGNISPEIWNLYPANLLDLIRNGSGAPTYTGPATPLIPGASGNGQGVLWDQGLKPPHP